MKEHWIAETSFVLRRRDGFRTPVHVAIGAPRQIGPDEWSCALSLGGVYDDVGPAVGGDAVQALGLAWWLARHLLTTLDGSGDVLEYENGEPVPLSAYFDPSQPSESHPAAQTRQ
ncbi:MAG TPA: hypothetical protein VNJ04_04850 [Gemmatimonadaceae bacterium]|nr:hypothetical protein [Gemmatimonadaceae bacterium]